MQLTRRAREVLTAMAAGALFALTASAATAQVVTSLTPLALRPGQTQDLVLRGNGLNDARQLWTNFPQSSALAPEPATNGKNANEVSFRLKVAPSAAAGIYGVRLATVNGVSPLRLLLVDDLATVRASGTNLSRAGAQSLAVPIAVEGSLPPLKLHYYKFHVEAGQRVSFEVYARRIGSMLDPTLRLFDSAGREVTYSDDVPGLSEDAAMSRTFAKPGDYVLELGDNLYQGGGEYFYRLRIGDFPAAALPLPLAATRGTEFNCQFADSPGSRIEPTHAKVPSDPRLSTMFVSARRPGGATTTFAPVLLSDRKQSLEVEPNNSVKTATRVDLGDDLNGKLEAPGDMDRFVFAAKANQAVRFTSISRRMGSPADVVLRLNKADGNPVASAESTGPHEANLAYVFPADGDYILDVRDLNDRGGPRFVYHVAIVPEQVKAPSRDAKNARPVGSFALAASADSLAIPAGGTASVTVTAERSRYGGPIAIRAVDLPPGIKSCPTWIGRGQDSVVLTLQATTDVPAGVIHSIQIVGSREKVDESIASSTTDTLRTQLGGMPSPPLDLCSTIALARGPHASFTLNTMPNEVVLTRGHSTTVKVIADRQKGFDEEIALAVTPAKNGLPPGVTATLKPIAKGATSAEITLTADARAATTVATAVIVGTLKKGNQAITEPAPGIGLKIERAAVPRGSGNKADSPRKTEGKKKA